MSFLKKLFRKKWSDAENSTEKNVEVTLTATVTSFSTLSKTDTFMFEGEMITVVAFNRIIKERSKTQDLNVMLEQFNQFWTDNASQLGFYYSHRAVNGFVDVLIVNKKSKEEILGFISGRLSNFSEYNSLGFVPYLSKMYNKIDKVFALEFLTSSIEKHKDVNQKEDINKLTEVILWTVELLLRKKKFETAFIYLRVASKFQSKLPPTEYLSVEVSLSQWRAKVCCAEGKYEAYLYYQLCHILCILLDCLKDYPYIYNFYRYKSDYLLGKEIPRWHLERTGYSEEIFAVDFETLIKDFYQLAFFQLPYLYGIPADFDYNQFSGDGYSAGYRLSDEYMKYQEKHIAIAKKFDNNHIYNLTANIGNLVSDFLKKRAYYNRG